MLYSCLFISLFLLGFLCMNVVIIKIDWENMNSDKMGFIIIILVLCSVAISITSFMLFFVESFFMNQLKACKQFLHSLNICLLISLVIIGIDRVCLIVFIKKGILFDNFDNGGDSRDLIFSILSVIYSNLSIVILIILILLKGREFCVEFIVNVTVRKFICYVVVIYLVFLVVLIVLIFESNNGAVGVMGAMEAVGAVGTNIDPLILITLGGIILCLVILLLLLNSDYFLTGQYILLGVVICTIIMSFLVSVFNFPYYLNTATIISLLPFCTFIFLIIRKLIVFRLSLDSTDKNKNRDNISVTTIISPDDIVQANSEILLRFSEEHTFSKGNDENLNT